MQKGEIWFSRGSPAADLAQPLRRRYALHPVDPPGHATGRERNGAAEPAGPAVWLVDPASKSAAALRRLARARPNLRLIAVADRPSPRSMSRGAWFGCLARNSPLVAVEHTVAAAFANIALAESERAARVDLRRAEREREGLNRIGMALSSTHDVGELLEMILAKTREITRSDAGSLYVVETVRGENGNPGKTERLLRFKLTQNDSREFPFAEYALPLDNDSLAGYAALHGKVVVLDDSYAVPRGRPYRFNLHYDQAANYRTRSSLTVPMKNARGEVIGVVQLLNRKRNRAAQLLTPEDFNREVQPFPTHAVRLVESLASQAAVAYENSRLYEDIELLFEGFVRAAVTAIEQRDPSTSGHSMRVSRMTVGLAEIVDRCATGTYRSTRFTADQMKEIRYAGLLHDFGKVGVREEVLIKAKKLYPAQFDVVQDRFDYARKELEATCERTKCQILLERPREQALRAIAAIDEEYRRRSKEFDEAFAAIAHANEPTVLPSGTFERLFEISRWTYRDPRGAQRPLLTPAEVSFLSIPRGSLDPGEREQIESHVIHSFNFLMQIPWTREIRNIPDIARSHHEKINGTGYPNRLKGEQIPLQARMMTICDIFDALSASDRPYKKAVQPERALAILEDSVTNHELDAELFNLFLQGRIYEIPFTRG